MKSILVMANNSKLPLFNLVAGMSRGGTNLVWSSLASKQYHFITKSEINQLFSLRNINARHKITIEAASILNWYASNHNLSKQVLPINFKMNAEKLIQYIYSSASEWIDLGQPIYLDSKENYTSNDLHKAKSINLKMVSSWYHTRSYGFLQRNNPLKYLPYLLNTIEISKIIFVVRHPFAQAEAWMRRGCSEEMALRMYLFYANLYLRQKKYDMNNKIILCPLQSFLNYPTELICKVHNLDTLHAFRVAKESSINNSQYRNTSNKISKLIPLQKFCQIVNPNIDDLHIKNFKGSKDTSQSLEALAVYKLILDNYS